MQLVMAKSLWGVEGLEDESNWDSILARISKDGYTAIECLACFTFGSDSGAEAGGQRFHDVAAKHNLKIIGMIHSGSNGILQNGEYVYCNSYQLEDHLESVEREIDIILMAKPILINCHAGVDAWDHETQVKFLLGCIEIAKTKNIGITFETHRQRIFCNPFQTRALLMEDDRLKGNMDLKLTADLSHWVVACERQLHTPNCMETKDPRDPWWPELLKVVAAHTVLIHCRVGHPQGPQVADVTDPVHKVDVRAHLDMWKEIWKVQRAQGVMTECICEVEHGPAPYLQTLPHTGQPVADLWKVNNDVAALVRTEFQDSS